MMRFYAKSFAAMVSRLERAESALQVNILTPVATPDDRTFTKDEVRKSVEGVIKYLEQLPISTTIKTQAERVRKQVTEETFEDAASQRVTLRLLQELKFNIVDDLNEHLFLFVPAGDKSLFLMSEADYWTPDLVNSYVDAHKDLKACAQCLALGMTTASVFHAMRAVQHGLRRLSDRFNVTFSKDFDVLNWGQIIKELDRKLKDLEQTPKTPERDAELEFGAKASSHFFAIKEAWRNYVMHGRSTYDEPEARAIAANVRSILLALV